MCVATTYNNLYLDARKRLKAAGVEAAQLEARELVCFAAGKNREQFLRDMSLYASDEVEAKVAELLDAVHDNLFAMALKNREENTFDIKTPAEAKAIVEGKGGFLRSKWCGALECEMTMKERSGVTSRCMPLEQSGTEGVCPVCGKTCTTDIYWGVAY